MNHGMDDSDISRPSFAPKQRDDIKVKSHRSSSGRRHRFQRRDATHGNAATTTTTTSRSLSQSVFHRVFATPSMTRLENRTRTTTTESKDTVNGGRRRRHRQSLRRSAELKFPDESGESGARRKRSNQLHQSLTHRHSFWCSMLNPRSKQWQASAYKTFITTIIGTDLLAFIAYSDPFVADWFNRHINNTTTTAAVWYYYYPMLSFGALEGVVSAIFLVEYILRIATITEHHRYGQHGPIQGRLLYATTTWSSWIDVCALAPYFIEQCTGLSLPTLTILRLFRLMRILKTAPYIRAMDAVYRVVYFNAEILYVALLVCFFLTLGTAVLLYLCRPPPIDANENGISDGRSDFSSIPATLYLSIALLTGQGGPRDEDDLPWYTKAIVVLTSLVSVVMFAIPASMLTWGWEAEAARMAKRARRRALEKQRVNREQGATGTGNDADTSSSSSDGETTDEEYFRVIAGEGDGDESNTDDAKKSQWMQEVREAFVKADSDGTGTLSLAETASLLAATTTSTCDAVGENGAVAATPFHTVLNRLDRYEEDLRQTNQKLDLILHLLQKG